MKTNKQNNKSELQSQSEQLNTNTNTSAARQAVETAVAQFSTPTGGDVTAKDEAEKAARVDSGKCNLHPIDSEQRKANRTLPTPKVLNLLLNSLPDVYRVAEVVGKWVWVSFKEQPAAEIRQQLAQLGFHWNRERQAWQHPCGNFRLSSSQDPHERYESYFPARSRKNTPQPAAA